MCLKRKQHSSFLENKIGDKISWLWDSGPTYKLYQCTYAKQLCMNNKILAQIHLWAYFKWSVYYHIVLNIEGTRFSTYRSSTLIRTWILTQSLLANSTFVLTKLQLNVCPVLPNHQGRTDWSPNRAHISIQSCFLSLDAIFDLLEWGTWCWLTIVTKLLQICTDCHYSYLNFWDCWDRVNAFNVVSCHYGFRIITWFPQDQDSIWIYNYQQWVTNSHWMHNIHVRLREKAWMQESVLDHSNACGCFRSYLVLWHCIYWA